MQFCLNWFQVDNKGMYVVHVVVYQVQKLSRKTGLLQRTTINNINNSEFAHKNSDNLT